MDHLMLIPCALAVTLAAVSCGRQDSPAAPVSARKAAVSFIVGESGTVKGTVAGEGNRVESLDLLVFRASDGMLDTHERVSGNASSVQASVSAGRLVNWYLVANAPEGSLSGFRKEAHFLSAPTLLEHSSENTLVLYAAGRAVFTEGNHSVDAFLVRYASKISVRKVTVDWPEAFLTDTPCVLKTVAVLNAAGSTPYSGIPEALPPGEGGVWFNRSTVDASLPAGVKEFLVWDTGKAIPSATPVSCGIELYAMPNPCTEDLWASDVPWSVRRTRIALELTAGGCSNWYSIDLPSMEGNTHYCLQEVVIKGPGMGNPDEELVRTPIEFQVSVLPWSDNAVSPEFPVNND